jgi:hypothetical protein
MQNSILIFFLLINSVNSFLFPNFFSNLNIPKLDLAKTVAENKIETDLPSKLADFNNHLISNSVQHFKTEFSPEIVKFSSRLLPAMDSIAHHVLKANENFIHMVLNSQIPDDIKKDLVLFSISSAQHGDQMGSQILDFYYHLVEKLL